MLQVRFLLLKIQHLTSDRFLSFLNAVRIASSRRLPFREVFVGLVVGTFLWWVDLGREKRRQRFFIPTWPNDGGISGEILESPSHRLISRAALRVHYATEFIDRVMLPYPERDRLYASTLAQLLRNSHNNHNNLTQGTCEDLWHRLFWWAGIVSREGCDVLARYSLSQRGWFLNQHAASILNQEEEGARGPARHAILREFQPAWCQDVDRYVKIARFLEDNPGVLPAMEAIYLAGGDNWEETAGKFFQDQFVLAGGGDSHGEGISQGPEEGRAQPRARKRRRGA